MSVIAGGKVIRGGILEKGYIGTKYAYNPMCESCMPFKKDGHALVFKDGEYYHGLWKRQGRWWMLVSWSKACKWCPCTTPKLYLGKYARRIKRVEAYLAKQATP
jgi:hypothetical protein